MKMCNDCATIFFLAKANPDNLTRMFFMSVSYQ